MKFSPLFAAYKTPLLIWLNQHSN